MPHVLIIHEVEAYLAWKVVFDRAADIRKHAGEIRYQLLRHDRDANSIVHFSEWSSLEQARRFFESPELVEILETGRRESPEFLSPRDRTRRAVPFEDRSSHKLQPLFQVYFIFFWEFRTQRLHSPYGQPAYPSLGQTTASQHCHRKSWTDVPLPETVLSVNLILLLHPHRLCRPQREDHVHAGR